MLAYAAGDATAFDALYARHKGGLYRYLMRQCAHTAVVDELFQDIWLSAIRARNTYAPSAKFTTWLYRIAHNRLIDHWRSAGRVELIGSANGDDDEEQDDLLAALPGARNDDPEVRASAREIATRLHAALSALPPAQRDGRDLGCHTAPAPLQRQRARVRGGQRIDRQFPWRRRPLARSRRSGEGASIPDPRQRKCAHRDHAIVVRGRGRIGAALVWCRRSHALRRHRRKGHTHPRRRPH